MGGKLTFLLEYSDYIDNIEKLLDIDDRNIYDKFKKQRLVEGLIKTHPLNLSINIIRKRFPYLECEIEPDGYIEGEFKELKNYLPIFVFAELCTITHKI